MQADPLQANEELYGRALSLLHLEIQVATTDIELLRHRGEKVKTHYLLVEAVRTRWLQEKTPGRRSQDWAGWRDDAECIERMEITTTTEPAGPRTAR